jgi:hypothetical protein
LVEAAVAAISLCVAVIRASITAPVVTLVGLAIAVFSVVRSIMNTVEILDLRDAIAETERRMAEVMKELNASDRSDG